MKNSLKRAVHAAFRPNAAMMGVATFLFAWSVVASLLPAGAEGRPHAPEELLFLTSGLLVAAAGLAAGGDRGRLLAVALSSPLPLIQIFAFTTIPRHSDADFLSAEHVGRWLDEMARMPWDFWLLSGLSFAILCSATAATLRRTPSQP